MKITRKTVLWAAVVVVALFLIAAPLGDAHHGIGAHHKIAADFGNVIFGAFLMSVPVFALLLIVAVVQYLLRTRRNRDGARLAGR